MHGMNGSGIFSGPNFHSSCFAFKACPLLSHYLEKFWFKVILLEACTKKNHLVWSKTPGINPTVTVRFKEIVLIIVLDEWQRAIFSKLGLLHYLMLIDLNVRVCTCVTPASMRPHTRRKYRALWLSSRLFPSMCVMECLVLFFMANLLPYVSCRTRRSTEREREKRRESRRVGCVSVSSNSCSLHW